jgi:hypothetical protein
MELEAEEKQIDTTPSKGSEINKVPEDIWSVHRAMTNTQQDEGMIRFAEDIADLKGGVTARKDKRGSSPNVNARSKKTKSRPSKKRR